MPTQLVLFAFLARLAILLGVAILTSLIVLWGRRYVERHKQRALSAPPASSAPPLVPLKVADAPAQPVNTVSMNEKAATAATPVLILVFSSDDCSQCHMYQTPALHRVAELREDVVTIVEIDAPSSPDMTKRYQVLTVPTTVILDETGKAHAINYGFANAQKLLGQVDEVVAHSVGA